MIALAPRSSAETGSSQTINRGLVASARAMPIRCHRHHLVRIPVGVCAEAVPDEAIFHPRGNVRLGARPNRAMGRPSNSRTVLRGFSDESALKDDLGRSSIASKAPVGSVTISPAILTDDGSMRRRIARPNVPPEPDSPTSPMTSPEATDSETLSIALTSLRRKLGISARARPPD